MKNGFKKAKKRLEIRIKDFEKNLQGPSYTKPGSMKK